MNISANGGLNIIGYHLCRSATIAAVYDNARTGRGVHVRRIVRVSPAAEIGDLYFPVTRIDTPRFVTIVVVVRIIGHIGHLRLRTIVPIAASGESHCRNKQHQKNEYLFHIGSFFIPYNLYLSATGLSSSDSRMSGTNGSIGSASGSFRRESTVWRPIPRR